MYCNICGAPNADDAKFCINCGSPLPVKKIVPEDTADVQTPVQNAAEPASEQQNADTNGSFSQPETEQGEFSGSDASYQEQAQQPYGSYNAQQNYYNGGIPPIPAEDPYKGKATGGMICGIIALILCIITCCLASPVSLILGIIAIGLSASVINKTDIRNKNKATAGLVCGIIAAVFAIAGIIIYSVSIKLYANNPDVFKEYSNEFNHKFGNTFNTFISFLF